MAGEQKNGVGLKLLVDKKKSSVVFAESDSDFVNILFSFLTIPMGKVVSLTSKPQLQEKNLVCFNNLYQSVEKIDDVRHFHFQTNACKSMLLSPRSSAESHYGELKLQIDDSDTTKTFLCSKESCRRKWSSVISHYADLRCRICQWNMNYVSYSGNYSVADKDGSVFVEGGNRFIITDDLQVTLATTETIFSLLSNHGITSKSELEEMSFKLDTNQVKTMFIYSLASRKVLTDTFLKNQQDLKKSNVVSFFKLSPTECGEQPQEVKGMAVKLIVSKSRSTVCYAEVSRDFVNLLFSFLTVPIGHIWKQIHHDSSLNRSINHLYKSVLELDDNCFRSIDEKRMLVSPSLSLGSSYRNDLLGIQKSSCSTKQYSWDNGLLTGPTVFVVTDCLKVTPISATVCLSILEDLNVRSDDIVEHAVHVGGNVALLLLVSSFLTKNALTNTFFNKEPKQEK